MEIIEDIAKTMQSKGYCEKSSYQWIAYVLSSMIDIQLFDKVKEIADQYEQQ
jgi:hypothetical protein